MRLIHTSDLQIGKGYAFFDRDTEAVLREARQQVIRRLGERAVEHGVTDILIAGDVYEHAHVSGVTLRKPIETMRQFPKIRWWLLPGNHDPHTDGGLWANLTRSGLPENVRPCLEAAPLQIPLADAVGYLLPAPLRHISSASDLSEWMDEASTPEGAVRIGMAHGSITGFDSEGDAKNYIDPRRPQTAGLTYLAMGDWHRQQKIDERIWYSGTPEPDRFKVGGKASPTRCNGGHALLVEIDGPSAPPRVTPVETGQYAWHLLERTVISDDQIEPLEAEMRALEPNLGKAVVSLRIAGTLSLKGLEEFSSRIVERFGASVAALRLERDRLIPLPTEDDLDAIDRGGFIRVAADRLRAITKDPSDPAAARVASLALNQLYLEHVQAGES